MVFCARCRERQGTGVNLFGPSDNGQSPGGVLSCLEKKMPKVF